jgi:DNA-binding CsgD family transcriptional regulator
VTAGAGVGDHARDVDSPPPFAYARCSRGPAGSFSIDYSDEHLPRILGAELALHLNVPAGAELAVALDAVLVRMQTDAAEIQIELSLIDPSGNGRSLHAKVHGLRIGGKPSATLALHDLTSQEVGLSAGAAEADRKRPALMSITSDSDGRLQLDFVDDDIRRLGGLAPDLLADTPAAAVILARAAAVLGSVSFSSQSPLAELTIADPWWGGRPLVCRFFRGTAGNGSAAVGVRVEEPAQGRLAMRAQARHSDALLRLLRLSEVLLEHPPQKEGMGRLVGEIASAPGIRDAAVARLDRSGRRLHVVARGRRADRDKPLGLSFSVAEGPCARAIAERRTIFDWPKDHDGICIYAPIEAADEVLGVLGIAADADLEIDTWQEEIVGSYADYIAAFIAGIPARPRALHRPGHGNPDEVDIAELLTTRQQDVLYLLVEAAASNRDISRALATTEATVKVHMRAILSALRVGSRAEALQLVYRHAAGWLAQMRRHHHENDPIPARIRRERDEPDRG